MKNITKLGAVIATVSLLSTTVFAATAKDTTTTKEVTTEKSATMGIAIDDTGITAKVKAALVQDSDASAMSTHVETKNGVVTLSGTLNTIEERDAAIERAKKIEGVKNVIADDLKVAQKVNH